MVFVFWVGCAPGVSEVSAPANVVVSWGGSPHGELRVALRACERCHLRRAWFPLRAAPRFDHDSPMDAAMALSGAHALLECGACHPRGRFKLEDLRPGRCEGCHVGPHAGHLFGGRPCDGCHSPADHTFASARWFDHGARTGFELRSGHQKLACDVCHSAELGVSKPPAACERCHAGDTPHGGRFQAFGSPPRCGLCHSGDSRTDATPQAPRWSAAVFDHRRYTKFPLTGLHLSSSCRSCHRGASGDQFEQFSDGFACRDCHAHRLAHADADHPEGQYTSAECTQCHWIRRGKR